MPTGEKLKSNGFTLIELLVVITIIAILSTFGLVLFGNVQSRHAMPKEEVILMQ